MLGMTKKIAISVPDDVAERLAREPNVSAYITDAVRRRISAERTREMLTTVGFTITDEDVERAGERIDRAYAGITPQVVARGAELRAEIARGRAGNQ
jgi:hypothetical protein